MSRSQFDERAKHEHEANAIHFISLSFRIIIVNNNKQRARIVVKRSNKSVRTCGVKFKKNNDAVYVYVAQTHLHQYLCNRLDSRQQTVKIRKFPICFFLLLLCVRCLSVCV